MLTAKDGAHDYALGVEPKQSQSQAYYRGYYDQEEQQGVAAWLRGEQLAEKGESLPKTASNDCKRGYEFRQQINQARAQQ